MAQQINVDITVKGQPINPFSSLTINQQFNAHHFFELRFNHDVIEERNAILIGKSKDLLGEQITITFSAKYDAGYPDSVFKGIITDIFISNDINSSGDLVFRGYSPTILLEGGEHNASFLDKNLQQIIKSTLGNIPGNLLSSNIAPAHKSSIPYLVQYGESNFTFLRRLAAEYGEWFLYDGSKLVFGKPSGAPTINMNYPQDISRLNLQLRMVPSSFESTAYFSKDDKKLESASTAQSVGGLNPFGNHALSVSQKLFQKPANGTVSNPVKDKSELDQLIGARRSAKAAQMVTLTGHSDSPYVKLGNTISVTGLKVDKSSEDFGKYVVTSVVHHTDGLGNYVNTFEAIPDSLKVMPNPYGTKPVAEPQLAVVKSTEDPDNIGRVKVQLLWQKDNETTPFIRVMSPHAGMRNSNKKNRGTFFTPEVDDYVMIGFHYNDPDRPFVMGSVPNGKAINTSMNSDNNAKAIRTRSGNTIYFYDKEKNNEQEIKIETDEKNFISIRLLSSKGTIKIITNDTIEIQSDKVINVTSKDINIKATNNIDIEANNNIIIKAGKNIDISAQKIAANGSQSIEAKGMEVKIEGSTTTSVKGGSQLNLEGGGVASLKGGMVKIN